MPFTKDGRWVPLNYEEEKEKRKKPQYANPTFDDGKDKKPSYDPENLRTNSRIDYGENPAFDADKLYQRGKTIGEVFGIHGLERKSPTLEPRKAVEGHERVKLGPSEERQALIPRTEGPQENQPLKRYTPFQGPSEQPQELIRRNIQKQPANTSPLDQLRENKRFIGPSEQPQSLIRRSEGTNSLDSIKERIGVEPVSQEDGPRAGGLGNFGKTLKDFLLPGNNEYKEGNTSLSELLGRPLQSMTDEMTFGLSEKIDEKAGLQRYGEADNFAEQVADKIGTGLGWAIGGKAVSQAAAPLARGVQSAGREIADQSRRLFRIDPPTRLPNPTAPTGRSLSQELATYGAGVAGFAGAGEMVEGFTNPDIEDPNQLQKAAGNMRYGFWQQLDSLGSFAESQGYNSLAKNMKDFSAKMGPEEFATMYDKEFSWRSMFDPDWYSTTAAQSLPSLFTSIPLGLAGRAPMLLAAGKLGMGTFGKTVMGMVGGMALAGPFESAINAGSAYDEAVKRGYDPDRAEQVADETFMKNIAIMAVTQGPELALMFPRAQTFMPQVQQLLRDRVGNVGEIGLRSLGVGAIEGIQEVAQEWATISSLGDEFKLGEQGESFALGALLGAGTAAVTGLAQSGRESANAPNPLPGDRSLIDPNNPIRIIQRRAVELMPDEMRADYNAQLDEFRGEGLADDVAEQMAWDAVAMTDEGKAIIEQATLQVLDDNARTESVESDGTPEPVQNLDSTNGTNSDISSTISSTTGQPAETEGAPEVTSFSELNDLQLINKVYELTSKRNATSGTETESLDTLIESVLNEIDRRKIKPTEPTQDVTGTETAPLVMGNRVVVEEDGESLSGEISDIIRSNGQTFGEVTFDNGELQVYPLDQLKPDSAPVMTPEPTEGPAEEVTLPEDSPINLGSRVLVDEGGESFTGEITDVDEMNGITMAEVTFDDGDVQLYPLDQLRPESSPVMTPEPAAAPTSQSTQPNEDKRQVIEEFFGGGQPSREQMRAAWNERLSGAGFSPQEAVDEYESDPSEWEQSEEMIDVLYEMAGRTRQSTETPTDVTPSEETTTSEETTQEKFTDKNNIENPKYDDFDIVVLNTHDEVREWLNKQPFVPNSELLSDGTKIQAAFISKTKDTGIMIVQRQKGKKAIMIPGKTFDDNTEPIEGSEMFMFSLGNSTSLLTYDKNRTINTLIMGPRKNKPEQDQKQQTTHPDEIERVDIDESELSDFRKKGREWSRKNGELFLTGDKVVVKEPSGNLREGTVVGHAGWTNEHSSTFLSVAYDDTGEQKDAIPVNKIMEHNGVVVGEPVIYFPEGFKRKNKDIKTNDDGDIEEDTDEDKPFDFTVKEMSSGKTKVTVKVPDSKRKVEMMFHGKGPLKGQMDGISTKEGNKTVSEAPNPALESIGVPTDIATNLDNIIAALEGREFETTTSKQSDINFIEHKRDRPFDVFKQVKEAMEDDMPFVPDYVRRGQPVQTYFFTAADGKNYVIFREEGKSPVQPQPADVFLKSAAPMDYSNEIYNFTPPTYDTTLEDLEIGDYVEFTTEMEDIQKGFVAEITEDGLVVLENAKGKRPWLSLEPNRLRILDQEDAPTRETAEKFTTVEESPLLLSEEIELTYTRNPKKMNRLEITFDKEIPSQVKAILNDLKIRWIKSQKVYAGAYSDDKMKKIANLKMMLQNPLREKQIEDLNNRKTEYEDQANNPTEDPNYKAPMGLYFYDDSYYLEENAVTDMKISFSSYGTDGKTRKSVRYKKLKDLPAERIFIGDVRNIPEDSTVGIITTTQDDSVSQNEVVEGAEFWYTDGGNPEPDRVRVYFSGPNGNSPRAEVLTEGSNTDSNSLFDLETATKYLFKSESAARAAYPALREEKLAQNEEQKGVLDRLRNQNKPQENDTETEEPSLPETELITELGDTTTVFSPRNTEVEIQYALVDVNELITSNTETLAVNPDYPAELQPRDRNRAGLVQQINTLSGTLNPALLGANPLSTNGAPIIGPDLVVESGNGRTMALRHVYNDDRYQKQLTEYRRWLFNNAANFGLKNGQINAIEKPVLVRVRRSDIDRVEFTTESNDATTAAMGASEQARADARKITGTLMNMFAPNDDGEINAAPNRPFIAAFLKEVVAETETNRLTTDNGFLSQDGLNRVRNAIFYLAYGDPRAIATLAESTDNNVRNIINSMLVAAPRVASTKEQINADNMYDLDISDDIVSSMTVMSDLRANDTPVDEYLNQLSLLDDELTPIGKEMLRLFDTHKRSVKKLSGILLEYYNGIGAQGNPSQASLFGEGETPTRERLLDISIRKVLGDDDLQTSLFESEQGQNLFEDGPINLPDEQENQTGGSTETAPDEEINVSESDWTIVLDEPANEKVRQYLVKYGFKPVAPGDFSSFVKVGWDQEIRDPYVQVGTNRKTMEQFRQQLDQYIERIKTEESEQDNNNTRGGGSGGTGGRSSGPRTGSTRPVETTNEELRTTTKVQDRPDRDDFLKRKANEARERYKKRHKGSTTAYSGLPFDDLVDLAIIGMDILIDKTRDFTEFTNIIVQEFGEDIRLFAGGIYGQSMQMLEMTEEELDKVLSLASNEGEETENGTEPAGDNGEGTLEETPSEDVQGNGTDGDIEPGTTEGPGPDLGNNVSDSDGTGTQTSNSTGSKRGAKGGTPKQPTESSVGNGEGDVGSSSGRGNNAGTRKPSGRKRNPNTNERVDFQITNELDDLGGAKTRFKNNIAALRTLVQIETESRLANSEEQSILAKYIGWGGISQAFDDRNKTWTKEYAELRSLVDEGIISQEDYETARASTTTAFYTSKEVIDGIYTALNRFGYQSGGRILEPSVGTGNFFGFMPPTMRKGTSKVGIELDNLTSRIAKQLYQQANIRNIGFQDFKIADGHFDVAVGNVPFGDTKIVDPTYKGPLAFVKNQIHNYFFIKSLDKVRDGGIVSFVTSSGTMNSKSGKKVRELIGQKADFLGAIRLPGNAFKDNANTEVTTDIIFLQKRPEGQRANHAAAFFGTESVTVKDRDGNNVTVNNNEYFVNNPNMELGERTVDKLTGKRLGLLADGRNFNEAFAAAINNLPANIYTSRAVDVTPDEIVDDVYFDMNELTEGGIGIQEGSLVQKVNGEVVKYTPKDKKTEDRIRGMLPIREAARNVLQLQKTGAPDSDLLPAQEQLNKLYDAFIKKFGYLNDQINRRAMSDDPVGASLLASLEHVKETGEGKNKKTTITKEAIFTERTINATSRVTAVDTAEEALVVTLFENGTVDLAAMAELSNRTEEQLIEELQGRIYKDPMTDSWITADEYLSGNVRLKFIQAEDAAIEDSSYRENVEALRGVIPEDLTPNQINVRLGAAWIPASDMQDFINELLDVQNKIKVTYLPQTAQWFIEESNKGRAPLYYNARNTSEYGVQNPRGHDKYALELIEDSLNLRLTNITWKDPITDKSIIDVELTNEARMKQKQIQSIFQDWLWEDESRADRLLREYNERFNSVRLREYDGSIVYGGQDSETNRAIPGMTEKYTLRPHQKDAVWRVIQGGNTLLAHVVGAGKTLEGIVAGMEMKRLGFVSKPAYVVPNHLLDQWEKEFREAYPGANILKIGNDDIPSVSVQRSEVSEEITDKSIIKEGMKVKIEGDSKKYLLYYVNGNDIILKHEKTGKNVNAKRSQIKYSFRPMSDQEYEARRKERQAERGAALNKIAVGSYDAILITHQTFQKLPVSPETVQTHIREQLNELESALRALAAEGENRGSRSIKALENAKRNLEAQILENLAEENKDIAIPFEELGIDQIFVDESHMFKNLKFHTKMHNVSGLPQTNSQRAQDMYLKTQWLSETREGKGVVFMSGTPISNTMAEMYNIQRYLQMRDLRANNLSHFDAWAALFGESITGIEMDTTGKFKQKTRFSRFHNVAELMTMFKSFADVKTADMLDLPTPDNVKHETIIAPMSDWQDEYLRELQSRAEAIKNGTVDPSEDNFLKLTSDGRKMALDVRMVNSDAPDFEESKLNKAVDNIARIYKDKDIAKNRDGETVDNHTQVVFLDMGTPRKKKETDDQTEESNENEDVSIYEDIRNKLIRQGVPKNEIAFIHDANTDKKKQALFNNMNEGKVRILIGSTEKMGAGMNVQTRLVALHHLDAPWRPSDVEQREGRIVRQGNQNNTVNIYSYTTERSFDAIMWDTIRRKATFIQQVMNGTADVRSIEDVEAMVMGYTQIAAVTSGNPLVLEQAELQKEMLELTAAKTGYERSVREARKAIREIPSEIARLESEAAALRQDNEIKVDTSGDKFTLVLGEQNYLERKEAGEALIAYLEDPNLTNDLENGEAKQIGTYAGFPLFFKRGMKQPFELRGSQTYRFIVNTESALGSVQRMDQSIANLDSRADQRLEVIKQENKNLLTYQKTVDKKFAQQDELNKVTSKLREIEQQIIEMDADDRATGGEDNEVVYSGTTGVDTFVEPVNTGAEEDEESSGYERRRWRGRIFENQEGTNDETRSIKRNDIVAYISQAFKVPIGTGRYKGRAKAIYKRKPNVIRTKEFADFVAITHELGHRLDDKYNFSLRLNGLTELESEESLLKEIYDLAINNLNPDVINPTVPAATVRREGFAEFMRLYFDNQAKLNKETPQFLEYFLRRMGEAEFEYKKNVVNKFKNMPDVKEGFKNATSMLDNLDIAAELLDIWRDQDPRARIRGVIDTRQDRRLRIGNLSRFVREKYTTTREELYDSLYEELAPIDRSVRELTGQRLSKRNLPGSQDPFVLAWNSRGVSGKIRSFIDFGVVDDNGQKVGRSLREILEGVEDLEVFSEYLVAIHAKNLIQEHGKTLTPVAIRDADKTIRDTPEEYKEAANMLYEYQESVTNELVKAGLLATEQVDSWKLSFPYYVPFYRVMEDEGARGESAGTSSPGRRYGNQRNPVKRMKDKGSARNIIDPLESVIKNTYMYLQIAERNRVGRALGDLVDTTPDSGWLMEQLDTPMMAQKFSLNEIQNALDAANIDMENADLDQVAAVFRPMFMPSMSQQELTVYRDGKPVFYKVNDKPLFRGLLALERDTMNWMMKLLQGPNQLLRRTITATPDFIGRQLFRTIGTTVMQTQSYRKWGGLESIKLPFHALGNFVELVRTKKESARYYEWLSGGGAAATLQELDKDYLSESRNSLLFQKRGWNLTRFMNPFWMMDKINVAGQTLDEAFRMAEYFKALEVTGDRATAVQRSRDVDYDPSRFGNKTRNVNRILLFFNPAIQGLEKTVRTAVNNPVQFGLRGTIMLTLPTLVLLAMNWDDEEYWELPTWRRDMFWNIKIGGKFVSIPIPFEYGIIFKTLPERLAAKFFGEGNKEIVEPMNELFKNVWNSIRPEYIPTIIAPIIEWKTNTSLSFGSPIVPMGKADLEPAQQFNSNTSELAKLIGAGLNLSPMQIDNLYEGYTGTAGQLPRVAMDKFLLGVGWSNRKGEVPENQRTIIERAFKGFFPEETKGSSSINLFYNKYEKLQAKQGSSGKPGYVEPELKMFRQAAADLADMRAMKNWIVLDNATLTSQEKAQWVKDIDRTMVDYARVMLDKPMKNQATDQKVYAAMEWFKKAKQQQINQNKKQANRDFGYER